MTLLPANNDQFSAKLQAAFTSGQVPDAMLLYSGGYTTPYVRALTPLNSYINANPGCTRASPPGIFPVPT